MSTPGQSMQPSSSGCLNAAVSPALRASALPAPQPVPTPTSELGEELLSIGELAKLCDVTVRTLRYYEEMDLIAPAARTTGKYRMYDTRSVKRLHAIQTFQSLNYSLDQIVSILGPYSRIETLEKGERIENTRRSVAAQKAMVEARLAALEQIRQELDERLAILSAQCDPCCAVQPDACHEACEHQTIHWS